jgi:hypothetical protein
MTTHIPFGIVLDVTARFRTLFGSLPLGAIGDSLGASAGDRDFGGMSEALKVVAAE